MAERQKGKGSSTGEPASEASVGGRVVLTERWRLVLPGRISSVSLAWFSSDTVLAENRGRVTCADGLGVHRWEFDAGADHPQVAITADGRRTAVLARGNLWWLDGEGRVLWQKQSLGGALGLAVEPLGRRIICASDSGRAFVFAPSGRPVGELRVLFPGRFVAVASVTGQCVVASEFGDLAAFDLSALESPERTWFDVAKPLRDWLGWEPGEEAGEAAPGGPRLDSLWRRRLAMPVAGLAVSQSGGPVLLASPQDRVYAFSSAGESLGTYAVGKQPSAVACNWTGSVLFFANGERQLLMMDREGGLRFLQHTEEPLVALAADALANRLLAVGRSGEVVLFEVTRPAAHRTAFLEWGDEALRTTPSARVRESWQRDLFSPSDPLPFGRVVVSGRGEAVVFVGANQSLTLFDRGGTQLLRLRLPGAFLEPCRATSADVFLAYTGERALLLRPGGSASFGRSLDLERQWLDVGQEAVAEATLSEDGSLALVAGEAAAGPLRGHGAPAKQAATVSLASEGVVLWRRSLGGRPVALAVGRRQGVAVALSGEGELVAWKLSGDEVFRQPVGAEDVIGLLLLGEMVILVCRTGAAAGLGLDGERRWRKTLASQCVEAYPVGGCIAVREATGALLVVTPEGEVVSRRRGEAEGALLVEGEGGSFLLLDVVDGEVRCLREPTDVVWTYTPSDYVRYLSASTDGRTVAVVAGRTLALVEPWKGPRVGSDWVRYLEL